MRNNWQHIRKIVRREIMNTDILCEIIFMESQKVEAHQVLNTVFQEIRMFEKKYSRFKSHNDLWVFNQSTRFSLSTEFLRILQCAQFYFQQTGGIFDPSILDHLEEAGYHGSPLMTSTATPVQFTDLKLNPLTHEAIKPRDLHIDIGGIGKGYIVDHIALLLASHFDNFLIDAGGDIYVAGSNQKENYPYWAINLENPLSSNKNTLLLMLRDMAVATSGKNRRYWQKNGTTKHHIIDPRTGTSAQSDILTVTVIAPSTISADILAKTIFISGTEAGGAFADTYRIPAIFITDTGKTIINQYALPYVWHA